MTAILSFLAAQRGLECYFFFSGARRGSEKYICFGIDKLRWFHTPVRALNGRAAYSSRASADRRKQKSGADGPDGFEGVGTGVAVAAEALVGREHPDVHAGRCERPVRGSEIGLVDRGAVL